MQKPAVSLKVMAEDKDNLAVSKTTQFAVDPRVIETEPGFNARPLDPEHTAMIKLAYKNGATLPPLMVRVDEGRIVIVDGHHRLAAIMSLIADGEEIQRVDAMHFRGNDAERITLMLTSAQGKPLTPLEMGRQYRKLAAYGWKVGKSTQHVSDMTQLAHSDTDVQDMVTRKEVSASTAVTVVKKHGSRAGKVLAGQLKEAKAAGKKKVTKPKSTGIETWLAMMSIDESCSPAIRNAAEVLSKHLRQGK
jgi:ParB-like chromosome segregation protein Spo0J